MFCALFKLTFSFERDVMRSGQEDDDYCTTEAGLAWLSNEAEYFLNYTLSPTNTE